MASSNTPDPIVDEAELMKEIRRLRLIKNNLSARLFKLKSKLCISRPLSFKEYEKLVPQRKPVHNDSVEAYNLNLLARVCRMCGVQFTEANKNFFRAELTVMCGDLYHEGFFVEIKKIENDFHVGAYHIPIAINMKELVKQTPLKTYEDITVFLRFLHRCVSAYFHREKQVKEFIELFATYNIQSEVFATHNMRYLEFNIPANDFIVSDAKSLVSFCFVYNVDSLIPTNGSFVQKEMTEDDKRALFNCVELFMTEYLQIALVHLLNEKNLKKEVLSSSCTGRSEQSLKLKAIKPTEQMRSLAPVSQQISIHEEDKEKSSYSLDVSSITTSEVGKTEKLVKKVEGGHKGHPIAESTPFGLSRKLRNGSFKKKNEAETVSVKKGQQTSMRRFLHARNMPEDMSLKENTSYLPRRSNRNQSNLSLTENETRVQNVTNPLQVREVLSNSYEETPLVHFSKSKYKRNK